ncbi:hypothetical protein [Geobacter sp. DSM 9736]|uniref:hypothetical protein n=1 Tax=Geobacter sp. DSM 9736 TaxID=1277350 RepID=UPI000B50925F|nr:hypothetical protein [Geobacter sp. DSM 9736]SNB47226.1 hypothetical protein SAMN06269301_2704 [Geobacter sp. DSM 9736]
MVRILEKRVNLEFSLGHHLHCLIAQIPNHLRRSDYGFVLVDPEKKWEQVKALLDMIAAGEGNLKKLHFLMLPEASIPFARFDEMIAATDAGFRNNTVVMFGMEHVRLKTYRELLERYRADNEEAVELVDRDIDSGDVLDMPVNWCCIAIKEADGNLRVFLEAKSHPFHGEEYMDTFHDLYRGRHFYLFRSRPACFNFMTLICLDYLYRDLYASNIRQIIDHANQLFFNTRQGLDALFVIECNPKPEHRAYWEVLTGFYGEYLEDTPGIRETVTIFGNTSDETKLDDLTASKGFGHSFVVINRHHRLAKEKFPEFSTDDFNGAPVCRLRFGNGTRLYYFNLPLHHELDPRTSRMPLKVHSIMRWSDGRWIKVTGEEMVGGVELPREADS